MEEPEPKEGIWLQCAEKIKNIIFDDEFYSGEEWLPESVASTIDVDGGCVFMGDHVYSVDCRAYVDGGSGKSGKDTYGYEFNLITGVSTRLFIKNEYGYAYTFGNFYPQSGGDYIFASGSSGFVKFKYATNALTTTGYSFPTTSTSGIQVGDSILFYGKNTTNKAAGKYDMASEYAYPNTPPALSYVTLAPSLGRVGNEVYIMGGSGASNTQASKTTVLNLDTNTNRVIDNPGCRGGAAFTVGNELFSMKTEIAYNVETGTTRSVPRPTGVNTNGRPVWRIENGEVLYMFSGSLHTMKLHAKTYDQTSIVLKSTTESGAYRASIYQDENINRLPVMFAEAGYYKDGDVHYPPLYIGDGASWNKVRE